MATDRPQRKPQRKAIKSCMFCRQRKLKCDRERPFCSCCHTRNLRECLYVDTVRPSMPIGQDYSRSRSQGAIAIANPFRDSSYYYLQKYTNTSARFLYGPTSMRTYIHRGNATFMDKYIEIGSKNDSPMAELVPEEDQYLCNNQSFMSGDILDNIVGDLPSFETILRMINKFFHVFNKDLFPIYSALDRHKVLNDFYSHFNINKRNSPTLNIDGEKLVHEMIVPQGNNNNNNNDDDIHSSYFKIGVILMILLLTYYMDPAFGKNCYPVSIRKYFTILNGMISARSQVIERLQFLLLQYYYNQIYRSVDDIVEIDQNMESLTIVNQLVHGALSMGLDSPMWKTIFEGQESIVGDLKSVENLWMWIILADCQMSIHFGRPLLIKDARILNDDGTSHVSGETNKNKVEKSRPQITEDGLTTFMTNGDTDEILFYNKLKKVVYLIRSVIRSVYESAQIDPLQIRESINRFIENEFIAMDRFISDDENVKIPFRDYYLLSQLITLLIIFDSLCDSIIAHGQVSVLDNPLIKTLFLSFDFMRSLTSRAMKLDRERFPNDKGNSTSSSSPYILSSLLILNSLMPRSIVVFHSFLLKSISTTVSGSRHTALSQNPQDTSTLQASSMTTQCYAQYAELISKWYGSGSRDTGTILCRNKAMASNVIVEKNLATMVLMALESAQDTTTTTSSSSSSSEGPWDGMSGFNGDSL